MGKYQVGVIHGYPAVLHGVAHLLPKYCSTWLSGTGEDGVELARRKEPQCVVLGWDFPGGNQGSLQGLDVLRVLRSELRLPPQVIIYSSYVTPSISALALSGGAFDVVLFGDPGDVLIDAVSRARGGMGPRDESPLRTLRSVFELDGRLEFLGGYLTAKEHQVLKHVALGLSNLEISGELGIARETAKEHVRAIFRKLKVRDRTAAATWAIREGVVE